MTPHIAAVLCLTIFAAAAPAQTDRIVVGMYGGTGNASREKAIALGVDQLYPSITWYEEVPYMPALTRSVQEHGIKVLPSLAVGYDHSHAFAEAHPEFYERWKNGRPVKDSWAEQLSWVHPEVRAFKVQTVVAAVERWGVDGILLDYTRFFTTRSGYCEAMVQAFADATGRDAFAIDENDEQWVRFRAGFLTQFIRELRAALHEKRPGTLIYACANADPDECLRNNMQDWRTWMNEGLIDGLVSMIYTRDTDELLEKVQIGNTVTAGKIPHIPMVGITEGFMTEARLLREGGMICLASGAEGVAFYHDAALNQFDLWSTAEEVAALARAGGVTREMISHVQNGGFERGTERWAVGTGEGISVEADGPRLVMSFPGGRAIRQVIHRGLWRGHNGARAQVRYQSANMSAAAQAHLAFSVWDRRGKERAFRVPLDLSQQLLEVDLPLGISDEVKRIVISIEAEASAGRLEIDEIALRLLAEAPTSGGYEVKADRAAATPANVNVLRGQTVECSTYWQAGREPDNAVNGFNSSENHGKGAEWHSARPALDQWLTVILPQRQIISKVRMLNSAAQRAYRTQEYRLEVSLDGERYRQVAAGTLPDDHTTWTEVAFAPTPVRFLRFIGVRGYNVDYAVGLSEIEAYR